MLGGRIHASEESQRGLLRVSEHVKSAGSWLDKRYWREPCPAAPPPPPAAPSWPSAAPCSMAERNSSESPKPDSRRLVALDTRLCTAPGGGSQRRVLGMKLVWVIWVVVWFGCLGFGRGVWGAYRRQPASNPLLPPPLPPAPDTVAAAGRPHLPARFSPLSSFKTSAR